MITLITGNPHKVREIQEMLGIELAHHSIELPEIQHTDPVKVMEAKLEAAFKHAPGEYLVEDTSLTLACFNNQLPGPFIKWFEDVLTNDGIVSMVERMGECGATATTLLGYVDVDGTRHVFRGDTEGKVVASRGTNDFGFGPIFEPLGNTKTFGEMTREEKYAVSMRGKAVSELKRYLESRA